MTFGSLFYTIKQRLIRLLQSINRSTPYLDSLKDLFGLKDAIYKILFKEANGRETQCIIKTLDNGIIARKIKNLQQEGITDIAFYVLCVQNMGDVIASEPISRHLKKITPKANVHWIIKGAFKEIVEYNPNIDSVLVVNSLWEGFVLGKLKESKPGNILINCHFDGQYCHQTGKTISNPNNPTITDRTYYNVGTLLEAFSCSAGLHMLHDAPIFHLDKTRNFKAITSSRYIVLHCHSTDSNRDWNDKNWNRIAGLILSMGIHLIEIGVVKSIDSSNLFYHDYSGRRSLQDIAFLIKNATLFIGIDSGFGHIANCFKIESVILMGRYSCFPRYFPYNGEFSHSSQMHIIRAPYGEFASAIPYDTVSETLKPILESLA